VLDGRDEAPTVILSVSWRRMIVTRQHW
jgi:hypothetical protein